jgi:hypothetical protein
MHYDILFNETFPLRRHAKPASALHDLTIIEWQDVGGTTLVEVFRDMAEETKPEPCDHCKEQVTKSRHAEPHKYLRLAKTGSPYVNPYGMGGGVDSFYQCDLCGVKMFHSTDNYDFGWQL